MYTVNKKGAVPAPNPTGPLVVAADAAVNPTRGIYGTGHLATNGMWGLTATKFDGREGPESVNIVYDLVAIYNALLHLTRYPTTVPDDTPIHILTDSEYAKQLLNTWTGRSAHLRDGEAPTRQFPPGYISSDRLATPPLLVKLRALIQADADRYTWEWVAGHDGHPLNEFADSAAKLAMRVAGRSESASSTKTLPPQWAETRLADWRALERTKEAV